MVIIKKGVFIKKVKDITIGSTLSLMLIGGTASMLQSCSRGKEEYVETYSKGVQTHVKEEEKGVFKIVDETVTDSSETKAFVEYLDGRKDTLTPAQIKKLITTEVDTTGDWDETSETATEPSHSQKSESHYNPLHSGLGMLFWYSAMGHMFGRGTAFSNSRYYASPDVYNRSRQNSTQLQQSRVMRPTNSSKGFFRSFSRSLGG